MRPVVLDTSVVLPAVLSPRGYRRRFWVLLALGALAARRDLARMEADALRAEAAAEGDQLGGLPLDALVQRAEAGYARLSQALPHGCPDDLRMVASRPLLADAIWLIADDKKHISTNPTGTTEYQLPGSDRHVPALTFSRFLDHLTDIDLDQIDPGLIELAFRPPASQ